MNMPHTAKVLFSQKIVQKKKKKRVYIYTQKGKNDFYQGISFFFQGIEQWHVRKSYTEFDFQVFDFVSIATVSVLNRYLQRQKEV